LQRETCRIEMANSTVPNMPGQNSTAMANAGLIIRNMMNNKSKSNAACTLVDADSAVPGNFVDAIPVSKVSWPSGILERQAEA
jgi:hypothetical protein